MAFQCTEIHRPCDLESRFWMNMQNGGPNSFDTYRRAQEFEGFQTGGQSRRQSSEFELRLRTERYSEQLHRNWSNACVRQAHTRGSAHFRASHIKKRPAVKRFKLNCVKLNFANLQFMNSQQGVQSCNDDRKSWICQAQEIGSTKRSENLFILE